jgi:hypothetical protein
MEAESRRDARMESRREAAGKLWEEKARRAKAKADRRKAAWGRRWWEVLRGGRAVLWARLASIFSGIVDRFKAAISLLWAGLGVLGVRVSLRAMVGRVTSTIFGWWARGLGRLSWWWRRCVLGCWYGSGDEVDDLGGSGSASDVQSPPLDAQEAPSLEVALPGWWDFHSDASRQFKSHLLHEHPPWVCVSSFLPPSMFLLGAAAVWVWVVESGRRGSAAPLSSVVGIIWAGGHTPVAAAVRLAVTLAVGTLAGWHSSWWAFPFFLAWGLARARAVTSSPGSRVGRLVAWTTLRWDRHAPAVLSSLGCRPRHLGWGLWVLWVVVVTTAQLASYAVLLSALPLW